ncbi:potassium channel family protein [Lachnobacterium bovis]|jgi:trk system potassium uptake protein TrkA|uniref:Trk system potassium uptake protein TrkA n=1 Tax=Lachnobacterium bovis DSM 14045 TaxID=1122142 RepID=A0A1H3F8K1_9FIRM|nr:TrkA family potassium uptake protein [Lachnobacterium bovis]MBQ1802910.1 TrkA family potassium uptake protein [Lachnobacterium sp.]SDX87177.1 trk system potassium uptake protein TrkA [Lachnobacterium bovis DSM 14045]
MSKSVAVLGMGQFGRYITEELCESGADVLIADKNEEIINQYANMVSIALTAELSDPEVISNIGLSNMDVVVVSMGDNLESSIMCVMVAKEEGVEKVLAKASSERMANILKKVGADEIIFAEKESAKSNARKIMSSNFLEFFEISKNVCVVSLRPKKEWIGKSLKELRLREKHKINVITMKKNNRIMSYLSPEEVIEEGTELYILADVNRLNRLK